MEEEYTEVVDDSFHHYVIPLARVNDWDLWVQDEEDWDVPDYAERIDGGRLIFTDYRIGM